MKTTCFNNMRKPNPLKTSTITEIEAAANGNRRFRVTTLEYVSQLAKELGRGQEHTSTFEFSKGVFAVEVIGGGTRVRSHQDCLENGLSAMPMYNNVLQQSAFDTNTEEFLDEYRRNRAKYGYSAEELAEARNELGSNVIDIITGKNIFTGEPHNRNVSRRAKAASTLGKIETGETVTFPYNGQVFTAKVNKINTTTATVTIVKVEGRSNNPRQRPILAGATGVRVPASILARSL